MFKNITQKLAVSAALLTAGAGAFAAGPDLSTLSAAVDPSTVITAVLAVAALMIGVRLVQFAIAKVKASVK